MALITVVDDDELFTDMIAEWLRDAGHLVGLTHSGAEALMMLDRIEPDLVILDYDLPDMSGLAILRHVREKPYSRTTPVLMLTAKGGKLIPARARHEGADDYLPKPIHQLVLLAKVEALLAQR